MATTSRLSWLEKEIAETQIISPVGGAGTRSVPPELAEVVREMYGEDALKALYSPKPMLKVCGKPLIQRFIEFYAGWGFKEFVFLIGHGGEKIKEFIGNGTRFGASVRYSEDPHPGAGKGKALKNAILNGTIDTNKRAIWAFPDDIILYENAPLELLLQHFYWRRRCGTIATVLLVPWIKSPYGIAEVQDGLIVRFREKPRITLAASTGIIVMEPEVYKYVIDLVDMDAEGSVEFEAVVLPVIAEEGKLAAAFLPSGDDWLPVNNFKEWKKAEKLLKEPGK